MSDTEQSTPQLGPDPPQRVGWGRGRLLRLAASCPRCGTRPALRITDDAVRAVLHHPPEERLGTYQCHRRHCSTIYDLTAAAYHHAS